MRLTSAEMRWMEIWFRTILPTGSESTLPSADALPLRAFITDYFAHTPAGSSIGIRLASLVMTLLTVLRYRARLRSVPRPDRHAWLATVGSSRIYIARELPLLLKLTAFMAWDAQHEVQRQLGVTGSLGEPAAWLLEES